MTNNVKSQDGFTLVEVLVAMAIFAMGILAVVKMQLVSTTTNMKARYMTEGIVIAQSRVEKLRGLAYSHADLSDKQGDAQSNQNTVIDVSLDKDEASGSDKSDHMDLSHPVYKVYWNVRPDYPFDGTKMVRVIVKWDEKSYAKRFAMDMVKSDGD